MVASRTLGAVESTDRLHPTAFSYAIVQESFTSSSCDTHVVRDLIRVRQPVACALREHHAPVDRHFEDPSTRRHKLNVDVELPCYRLGQLLSDPSIVALLAKLDTKVRRQTVAPRRLTL